jgi:Tol biopolymer transport system component
MSRFRAVIALPLVSLALTARVGAARTEWGLSYAPVISADGGHVVFVSTRCDLVPGDTNDCADIFLWVRATRSLSCVTRTPSGAPANGTSWSPMVSYDGRYVGFASAASNLVVDDSNGCADVFVCDTDTGRTDRVSVSSTGQQSDAHCTTPSMSGDARYVVFCSSATNLAPGTSVWRRRVFMHDRRTGCTEVVSDRQAADECELVWSGMPSLSGDGRYVAFESSVLGERHGESCYIPQVFIHDRATGRTERPRLFSVAERKSRHSGGPVLTRDGRLLGITTGGPDSGMKDGVWRSDTSVLLFDRVADSPVCLSGLEATSSDSGDSWLTSISPDGRFIVFTSEAPNIVAGEDDVAGNCDVYVYDRQRGSTSRVSVSSSGQQGIGDAWGGSISGEGRYVAFSSTSRNLDPEADPCTCHVYLHDRVTGETTRLDRPARVSGEGRPRVD